MLTHDSPIADLQLSPNLTDQLTRLNYDTVGKLIAKSRTALADRMVRTENLGQLDAALEKHGLWYASEVGYWSTCTACPTCPDCGNPRALDARSVVADLHGRAKHLGGSVGPVCDGCHAHHGELVYARALELTGRLA